MNQSGPDDISAEPPRPAALSRVCTETEVYELTHVNSLKEKAGFRRRQRSATATGTATEADQARRNSPPPGVLGMTLCRINHPAPRRTAHNVHAGLPRGARCGRLFRLRDRPPARHRRGRSPPRNLRATTPMVRRWAAGTQSVAAAQKAGDEGSVRNSVQAASSPLPQSYTAAPDSPDLVFMRTGWRLTA